jgi:hypothetical protein
MIVVQITNGKYCNQGKHEKCKEKIKREDYN